MKWLMLAALLAVFVVVPSTDAQMISPRDPAVGGKVWPGREAGIAGYRVTRNRDTSATTVVGIVEKAPWYHFTDASGKKTSNLIDSVKNIQPILQADLDRAAIVEQTRIEEVRRTDEARQAETKRGEVAQREADVKRAEEAQKLDAQGPGDGYNGIMDDVRVSARSNARIQARSSSRTSSPGSEFVDQSASNVGYTPTGKALNVGPRGGIYHYSASGKKVYHSRKK